MLEEQKKAIESQAALKKASLDAQTEMRKTEIALNNLARQVEKNAYELTGQPPVQVCTVDQLLQRINGAVDEAVKITRKKATLEEALAVRRKGGGRRGHRRRAARPCCTSPPTSCVACAAVRCAGQRDVPPSRRHGHAD